MRREKDSGKDQVRKTPTRNMGYGERAFQDIGLLVPRILLPEKSVDMGKWAVIACDQYTSQKEYWEKVKALVGEDPSTLNLILPEAYLDPARLDEASRSINAAMEEYLKSGVLAPRKPGFVLVERTLPGGKVRKGLIVALDLERYDYHLGSQTLIRTTEDTYIERTVPRVRIRESAKLEAPHILVLIDDPERTVIEPLLLMGPNRIYDFDLMMGAGHVRGYSIDDDKVIEDVAAKLARLADPASFNRRYDVSGKKPFLYAMGDGNHSFATAQAVWERVKAQAADKEAIMDHPARYALVELVNIHDDGLEVEPIHRVVKDADPGEMFRRMGPFFGGKGSKLSVGWFGSEAEMRKRLSGQRGRGAHVVAFVSEGRYGIMSVEDPRHDLEMETLESFLTEYLKDREKSSLEFIHGDDVVRLLGSKKGSVGFFLPGIPKHEILKWVLLRGAFPAKTFSLGHADDKRFYLECRQIR